MQNGTQRPSAAELADRIVRLGRNGLGRVEIAAELGVGMAGLARMEARRPRLAAALAQAADAERAWWEALPREALAVGARFNAGAWREAMLWRFGVVGSADAEAGVGVGGAGAAGGAAEASARPRAIYLLPDNGKERGPDGKRLPAEERLKLVARPATERIEQLEGELARWRGIRAELEASVFEDDDEDDDDDWEDDEDGEGDDEIDDDEGDDGDGDDGDGCDGDECDGDGDGGGWAGGGHGGRSPHPRGRSSARVAAPTCIGGGDGAEFGGEGGAAGVGDGGRGDVGADGVSGVCAGRERAVSAGGAGAAAWAAQPAFGPGGPPAAAGLRR